MVATLTGLVPRRASAVALDRLRDDPVLLLQGPRSVGKSTLLREIAASLGARVIDLDDPGTRDVVASDPATYVGGVGPSASMSTRRHPWCLTPSRPN